jgi:hypothetical protein
MLPGDAVHAPPSSSGQGMVPKVVPLGEHGSAQGRGMLASEVPRAVAVAMSAASSLDLRVDDAIVLHDSNKLTLRLLPCDVLARVAPVAHQVAQFEVEIAQRLAESGCPVAALDPRVEPRAYERDGFVVTLWTYYEPASGAQSGSARSGQRSTAKGWIPVVDRGRSRLCSRTGRRSRKGA